MMAAKIKKTFHDPESALRALDRVSNLRRIHATMIDAASKDCPGTSAWFVLQVAIGSEKAVGERLDKKNIHNWIPIRKGGMIVRRGRKIPAKDEPAFPGYVLVRIVASAAAFMGLKGVEGIGGLLTNLEEPIRVSHNEISRIKGKEESGAFDVGSDQNDVLDSEKLLPGEFVLIKIGPFANYSATVTSAPVRGMINVELSLFGRDTSIKLPLACLERVSS